VKDQDATSAAVFSTGMGELRKPRFSLEDSTRQGATSPSDSEELYMKPCDTVRGAAHASAPNFHSYRTGESFMKSVEASQDEHSKDEGGAATGSASPTAGVYPAQEPASETDFVTAVADMEGAG
jgi:hypothetical protein